MSLSGTSPTLRMCALMSVIGVEQTSSSRTKTTQMTQRGHRSVGRSNLIYALATHDGAHWLGGTMHLVFALLAGLPIVLGLSSYAAADTRIADIVRAGKLRIGVFPSF